MIDDKLDALLQGQKQANARLEAIEKQTTETNGRLRKVEGEGAISQSRIETIEKDMDKRCVQEQIAKAHRDGVWSPLKRAMPIIWALLGGGVLKAAELLIAHYMVWK